MISAIIYLNVETLSLVNGNAGKAGVCGSSPHSFKLTSKSKENGQISAIQD